MKFEFDIGWFRGEFNLKEDLVIKGILLVGYGVRWYMVEDKDVKIWILFSKGLYLKELDKICI